VTRGLAKGAHRQRGSRQRGGAGRHLTPFHERYSTAEQIKAMVATIPQRCAGTAEDCFGAYLFPSSDLLSGYVTGQVIEVNGGQLMPCPPGSLRLIWRKKLNSSIIRIFRH
jgi:3-oxoacyl-[acyl-carrier protein] reductase